jgi:hypothetical protein
MSETGPFGASAKEDRKRRGRQGSPARAGSRGLSSLGYETYDARPAPRLGLPSNALRPVCTGTTQLPMHADGEDDLATIGVSNLTCRVGLRTGSLGRR